MQPLAMILYYTDMLASDNLEEVLNRQGGQRTMFCVAYCTAGSARVRIGDKNYLLHESSLLVFPPLVPASIRDVSGDFASDVIAVSAAAFEELVRSFFRTEPQWWSKREYLWSNPLIELDERQQQLASVYKELCKLYLSDEQTPYRQKTLQLMAQAVIHEVLGYLGQQLGSAHAGDGGVHRGDYLFKQFLDLLYKEYPLPREVGWYARRLCVSPKHLSATCTAVSGKSALQWINEMVMEEVKRLLSTTDLSIKEIAEMLGFPSQSFFGKYARRHLGLSPSEYRAQIVKM